MIDARMNTLSSRVGAQTLMAGDVARRTVNPAGWANDQLHPDHLAAAAARQPAGSLARDMLLGASAGARIQPVLGFFFGTGRHVAGPDEDTSGGAWTRLCRDWTIANDPSDEAFAKKLAYVRFQEDRALANSPDVGLVGVTAGYLFILPMMAHAGLGVVLGGAGGECGGALARAAGDTQSLAEDRHEGEILGGTTLGFVCALAGGSTIGSGGWAASVVSRLVIVAGITGLAAAGGSLVGAAGHAIGHTFAGPAPTAPSDVEAPLLD